uniref:Uncharacterized protein n=1 Tax=Kalanchoe fedtschenkoi TaxID=63787 RepID=A0A7N0TJ53_KALFE
MINQSLKLRKYKHEHMHFSTPKCKIITPKCDVFYLGILIHEILTAKLTSLSNGARSVDMWSGSRPAFSGDGRPRRLTLT